VRAKALTRGARATIKKGGVDGEIYSACDIPAEGAFAVRSVPPGQYTVVDSCGGWQHFEMLAGQEYAVILDGAEPGPTGEPGLSGMASSPTLHVGRDAVIRDPTQVAVGETITAPLATPNSVEADAPGIEKAAPLPDRTRQRGLAPQEDVRVPGGAGAGLAADVPAQSAADELHADEAHPGSEVTVPAEVRTTETSAPDRDTTLPAGEFTGLNVPRPLEGHEAGAPLVDGAPARKPGEALGVPPAPAKKPAARRRSPKKAKT
jgi:hypothetical protein